MAELDLAIRLAEKVLDDATRDPDSDLSMLSRQFLRSREKIDRLRAAMELAERCHHEQVIQWKSEIDRLRAEVAKRQWQDISTAPEDQRHVLAIHIKNGDQRVSWRDEINSSLYRYGGGEWIWQPTHWMPLPEPPAPAADHE